MGVSVKTLWNMHS